MPEVIEKIGPLTEQECDTGECVRCRAIIETEKMYRFTLVDKSHYYYCGKCIEELYKEFCSFLEFLYLRLGQD